MGLAVTHPDWTRALDGPFDVPLTGAAPARWIELRRGGRVTGRLLSAAGVPRAGERVTLSVVEPAEGPSGGSRAATTDRDGRFAFEHVGDGLWQLGHAIEGGMTTVYDLCTGVTIEDGSHAEVELRPEGSATLHGTLRFAGDLPEWVKIWARRTQPAAAETDRIGSWRAGFAERGRFTLEGLEPGEWLVRASKGDHRGGPTLEGETKVELAEGASADVWIDLVERD